MFTTCTRDELPLLCARFSPFGIKILHWHFVYVDDYLSLFRAENPMEMITVLLLFLAALGTPISWHKCHLGIQNTWLHCRFSY